MNERTVKRVLIVDDSSTMRAMLDGIMADQRGFVVVGLARGAKEAMSLVDLTKPDIVMTDLCMPDIDGATFVGQLEGYRALCKVVISTSANVSEAVRSKLDALGVAAIFDKQEIARDPASFLAALRRTAEGLSAPRSPALDRPAGPGNVIQAAARFPVPNDEAARARVVRQLDISSLDVDPRLNILARHLARLSGFPIAAINVIGVDRLWVRAAVGIVPQVVPRGESICAHAICGDGVTAIPDLLADPVLSALPMVAGGLRLRSYVGAPIMAKSGARLGMACIADTRPRHPTPAEIEFVIDVAALVASALQTPIPRLRPAA